jgi:hypothetical protein
VQVVDLGSGDEWGDEVSGKIPVTAGLVQLSGEHDGIYGLSVSKGVAKLCT